jgi:hypothetical protein
MSSTLLSSMQGTRRKVEKPKLWNHKERRQTRIPFSSEYLRAVEVALNGSYTVLLKALEELLTVSKYLEITQDVVNWGSI